MTRKQWLRAQWAAMDRLRDDMYLMPADDEAESTWRAHTAAHLLVNVWVARLVGLERNRMIRVVRSTAPGVDRHPPGGSGPGRLGRLGSRDFSGAASRGCQSCWDATAAGMPLSPDRFVLAGDGPWASVIRCKVMARIAGFEEKDDPEENKAEAFLYSLLLPLEDQARCRQNARHVNRALRRRV